MHVKMPAHLKQMEEESKRQREGGLGEDRALKDKQSVTHVLPVRPHLPGPISSWILRAHNPALVGTSHPN